MLFIIPIIFCTIFSHANEEVRNDTAPMSVSLKEKIHTAEEIVQNKSGDEEAISLAEFLKEKPLKRDVTTEL